MQGTVPPIPRNERERLEKLHHYHILDSPPEPVFDNITRLASLICNTPMAIITLVDEKRQWFKSKLGMEVAETPREVAFCAYTIHGREVLVVNDALKDSRFAKNPLVVGPPNARFYAGAPLVAPGECVIGTLAVLDRVPRDITAEQRLSLQLLAEQVVSELEMRRRTERTVEALRGVVQACPLAIIAMERDGKILMCNESAEAMFGFSQQEMIGKPVPYVPPEQQASFNELSERLKKGEILRNVETKRIRKDGVVIDVAISAAPLRKTSGEVVGFMAVMDEITERKRSNESLQRSLSLLRATLESTADGLMAVDRQGRIVMFNRRLADMWGISQEIIESGDMNRVIERAAVQLRDPEHFLEKIRRYVSGAKIDDADVLHFKDGRIFERFSAAQVVNGETVGRVFSYRDMTRRIQLEEQLRQAQKMEAIGQLAGGIAHDFNNLLNVIVGYTALLQARIGDDPVLSGHAEQVMKAADRATALTRQLLVFSRKQVMQTEVLDLNRVVTELAKMLPRLLGEDIELVVRPGENLGSVRADPGQVEQVLMNLAINARDAMPQGGLLEITTQNTTFDREISGVQAPRPGDYVVVSVRDTGEGMSDEVRAHIFEPFFTTKQPGKGTGLGLATVYAIVRQSGGFIEVDSNPEHGSVFRVYLPRVDRDICSERPAEELADRTAGGETILVVEDESSLRELMAHVLNRWGYKVIEAQDGSTALGCLQEYEGPLDLLITDVVMPGMRGWEVTERISRVRPGVKVLYISGYADDLVHGRKANLEGAAFLQKPFTPDALVKKVREVLASTTDGQPAG